MTQEKIMTDSIVDWTNPLKPKATAGLAGDLAVSRCDDALFPCPRKNAAMQYWWFGASTTINKLNCHGNNNGTYSSTHCYALQWLPKNIQRNTTEANTMCANSHLPRSSRHNWCHSNKDHCFRNDYVNRKRYHSIKLCLLQTTTFWMWYPNGLGLHMTHEYWMKVAWSTCLKGTLCHRGAI